MSNLEEYFNDDEINAYLLSEDDEIKQPVTKLCPKKKIIKCQKENKICNPNTGRCVKKSNKKGDLSYKIINELKLKTGINAQQQSLQEEKVVDNLVDEILDQDVEGKCTQTNIDKCKLKKMYCNPNTGRCVKKNSGGKKIHEKLLDKLNKKSPLILPPQQSLQEEKVVDNLVDEKSPLMLPQQQILQEEQEVDNLDNIVDENMNIIGPVNNIQKQILLCLGFKEKIDDEIYKTEDDEHIGDEHIGDEHIGDEHIGDEHKGGEEDEFTQEDEFINSLVMLLEEKNVEEFDNQISILNQTKHSDKLLKNNVEYLQKIFNDYDELRSNGITENVFKNLLERTISDGYLNAYKIFILILIRHKNDFNINYIKKEYNRIKQKLIKLENTNNEKLLKSYIMLFGFFEKMLEMFNIPTDIESEESEGELGKSEDEVGKGELGKSEYEESEDEVGEDEVGEDEESEDEVGKGEDEVGKGEDEVGEDEVGKGEDEVGEDEVGKDEVGKDEVGKDEVGKDEESDILSDENKDDIDIQTVLEQLQISEDKNILEGMQVNENMDLFKRRIYQCLGIM